MRSHSRRSEHRGRPVTALPIWTAKSVAGAPNRKFSTFPQAAAIPPDEEQDHDMLRQLGRELHQQMFEAAQVQRKLSGPRVLRRGDIEIASEVFAAKYVSGDFTALWEINDSVICAIGDIAGKGVAAGMWFTYLVGMLQRHCMSGADPAEVAAELNANLCCLRPSAPFVTLFLAKIDWRRAEITYCNAGHYPPVLLREYSRTELLESGGPLLGALADAHFESACTRLELGDSLIAYSDGVLECHNAAGDEFGVERVVWEAQRSRHLSADLSILSVLGALQDFANGMPLCDDMSLMIVQHDCGSQLPLANEGRQITH